MSRVIAVLACGFSLAACSASMPSLSFLKSTPPTETLRIESEPPGADAKISQGGSCRTPCELIVPTGDSLTVTLALAGHQSQTVAVAHGGEGEAGPRLTPNPNYVQFTPAPATPPAKKQPAKKKPKPQTASARPAPAAAADPAPTASVAAPQMAPTTTAEPAASATQYPWPSR